MNRTNYYLLRCAAAAFFLITSFSAKATDPRSYAVELSALTHAIPPQVALNWTADISAPGYSISRKAPSADSWTPLATLPGSAVTWTDLAVANGSSYEYAVTKTTSAGYSGTGYLLAGINTNPVEFRGKVVLIVDNSFSSTLASELARLQQDLIGDGWTVLRHDISRAATVPSIKALIQADYNADPVNVKSVFLFGHVPVPYSGDNSPPPDGHPEHAGAWPADSYYADMDGVWTDSTVNNIAGTRVENHNVPGDGKFDQTDIPSPVELQVGRVDLSNMTCFSNKTPARSELDLLRAYLNKDHNFGTGAISIPRRTLIRDTFGDVYGENFASSGWRNGSSFFGPDTSFTASYYQFVGTLRDNGYLYSYGTGGGSFTTCDGVATSDDFALNNVQTVFMGMIGSYFGDWDNESSLLRAPLGSGTCLAVMWDGRPHWFLHHMGLGETIGYSTKVSQNNVGGGLYGSQNWGTHRVHISLMGDPTLRLHPVVPPANLAATAASSGVSLGWSASSDGGIQGYYVYRASSMSGPFTRVGGGNLITSLNVTDPAGTAGSVYMVRAFKMEFTSGGSYYNPSVGTFATTASPVITAPSAPSNLTGSALSQTSVRLQWTDNASNESGFNVMRKAGANGVYVKLPASADATSYTDTGLSGGTQYFYKLSAWNSGGESAFSSEITVTTLNPLVAGSFLGSDSTTGGTWKGVYGSEGYNIISDLSSYPTTVTVSPSNQTQWVWSWNSTDPAALLRVSDNSRLASCWYSFSSFNVGLNCTTSAHHRLTVYCLDWDAAGRIQALDLLDANQTVLQTRIISNFQKGIYVSFDIAGAVTLRVRAISGNAVISGLFLDPLSAALPQVATPVLVPGTGSIAAGQAISILCATPGATIRYSTDGSAPNSSSAIYTGPITLLSSGNLSARGFASGMSDSALVSGSFIVTGGTTATAKVSFLGLDSTREGNWKGAVGTEAYTIAADSQVTPSTIAFGFTGKSDWIWDYGTGDVRALQLTSVASRNAACAYGSTFQYDVDLRDTNTHTLSIYCLDWDRGGRVQNVDILDYNTKAVLHSFSLSSFGNGTYLKYAVKGHVSIRFTSVAGPNAVASGIFIDPSATQL